MNPKVSIIIRTKNEERWIKTCLDSVFDQSYKNFEVILVDNMSTDSTQLRAKQYPIKIVEIEKYLPGDSLNVGVRNSTGDILVFLSGHCVPADQNWLANLVEAFTEDGIVGVYGRQLPMSFTSAQDRRDLFITFGLDEKIQLKDSFFHNANSAIRRSTWEKIPFDNKVTNIEDRIWAATVQKHGYKIKYTPNARVYHHHGIHHGGNPERALSTLKVIQEITGVTEEDKPGYIDPNKLKIMAFIPIKGSQFDDFQKMLLKQTISHAKESKYIKQIIVLTESEEISKYAQSLGAKIPFLRDKSLGKDHVDLSMLYEKTISDLESAGIHPDLLVSIEPHFIKRPEGIIDSMIEELLERGLDSIVPVVEEFNACWKSETYERVDDGEVSRTLKKPLYVSNKGLALVLYPELIRKGSLYGVNCGLHLLKNKYSFLEVRDAVELSSLATVNDLGALL